jgi:hypothetical protein
VTTNDNTCKSVGELLGVYALDALDSAEAEIVEVHVRDCPRCAQEVDEHRETIGLLAAGGGDAPTRVWDAIAAAIEGTAPPVQEHRPPVLIGRGGVKSLRWRQPSRWLAAAAAAAAAIVIGAQTVRVDHLDHRVSQLSAAAQQLSAAAQQNGGFQAAAAALIDPAATHLVLTSTNPGAKRLGELVILPSGSAYLVASAMPALPATSTYQLWSVVGGRAISVGLLGAHPATVAFSVDPAVAAKAYLVTVEPAGGAVAPTSSPIAQAAI